MKAILFALVFMLSLSVCAQNEFEISKVFLRVFDLQGKKIGRGKIISFSELSLQLDNDGKYKEIPVSSIGLIKTKHSGGNNLLIGAAAGAVVVTVLGSAGSGPSSRSNSSGSFNLSIDYGVGELAPLGMVVGAVVGGCTVVFKKSKRYDINGEKIKWKEFTEAMLEPVK